MACIHCVVGSYVPILFIHSILGMLISCHMLQPCHMTLYSCVYASKNYYHIFFMSKASCCAVTTYFQLYRYCSLCTQGALMTLKCIYMIKRSLHLYCVLYANTISALNCIYIVCFVLKRLSWL